MTSDVHGRTISELDGTGVADADHMVTETLLRGMYKHYRDVMAL